MTRARQRDPSSVTRDDILEIKTLASLRRVSLFQLPDLPSSNVVVLSGYPERPEEPSHHHEAEEDTGCQYSSLSDRYGMEGAMGWTYKR